LSGWRVRETHRASSAVSYVWDLNASLPVTLQDTAGNRYVYGLDLLTRIDGADEEWYLYDGLGSTTGLADDTGTVTGTYEYDVFGAVRSHTGDATEWSYTGEQHDATGLEYLRARYYDALTGRLLSVDPIPATQRYPYVGQNPTNYTDSSGLCVEPASATVVSGATAVETAGVGPALCWATFAGVATCTVISGCREAVADGAEGIVQGVGSALDAGAEFVGNLNPFSKKRRGTGANARPGPVAEPLPRQNPSARPSTHPRQQLPRPIPPSLDPQRSYPHCGLISSPGLRRLCWASILAAFGGVAGERLKLIDLLKEAGGAGTSEIGNKEGGTW
jgi:RHS repeat-associated protein